MFEVLNNLYTITKIIFVVILCYLSVKMYIQKLNDHTYNEILERIFDCTDNAIKESEFNNFDIIATKAYTKFYNDIPTTYIVYLNKNYTESHKWVKMKIVSYMFRQGFTREDNKEFEKEK